MGGLGRCLIPTAVGPWLSSRVRLSLRSARGERLVGLYGGDDVAIAWLTAGASVWSTSEAWVAPATIR